MYYSRNVALLILEQLNVCHAKAHTPPSSLLGDIIVVVLKM